MPLLPGKKNIGANIKTEEAAGKPRNQALAIALSTAYGKKKSTDGVMQKHQAQKRLTPAVSKSGGKGRAQG